MVKLQVAGLAAIFELEMGLELGFETDLDCKTTLGGGGRFVGGVAFEPAYQGGGFV